MNGLLHQEILAHLPGLAGALQRLRRPPPALALPLYRSEGFGEDLEAFDARYRPGAIIGRPKSGSGSEERRQ